MKNTITKTLILAILAAGFIACSDSASKKKIAVLEEKIAKIEANKTAINSKVNTPVKPVNVKPEGPIPVFTWTDTEHDFGTINEKDVVTHTYSFKNTGQAPLIIESVRPSCGCTAPNWTKNPIPVGGEGFVDVKFDSKGKKNAQNKTVTVTANTWPKQTILRFKSFVKPSKK